MTEVFFIGFTYPLLIVSNVPHIFRIYISEMLKILLDILSMLSSLYISDFLRRKVFKFLDINNTDLYAYIYIAQSRWM